MGQSQLAKAEMYPGSMSGSSLGKMLHSSVMEGARIVLHLLNMKRSQLRQFSDAYWTSL